MGASLRPAPAYPKRGRRRRGSGERKGAVPVEFWGVRALVLVIGIVLLASTAVEALTSAHARTAGEGTARVSGVTVSDVRYELDGADPELLGAASFAVEPAAETMSIRLARSGS